MVCGQIHAPANLPNYVHMNLMNSKFSASHPVIIETAVFFYAKQLTHFLLNFYQTPPHSSLKPHSLCHTLLLQELLQMLTSYVAEFSCCVPHSVPRSGEQSAIDAMCGSVPDYVIETQKHSRSIY